VAIHEKFSSLLAEEEERTDQPAPDLPPEDDSGNIEYKYKLCDLTMYKIEKRTTQMRFRLYEGRGVAYYEIGVHDNGELIGIDMSECCHSILALFHMSKTLGAKLIVTKVRLGQLLYSA